MKSTFVYHEEIHERGVKVRENFATIAQNRILRENKVAGSIHSLVIESTF
jgi:hypothetical protein